VGWKSDDHDWEGAEGLSDEEKEALGKEIDRAIRQGAIEKKAGQGAGGRSQSSKSCLTQVDCARCCAKMSNQYVVKGCIIMAQSQLMFPVKRHVYAVCW